MPMSTTLPRSIARATGESGKNSLRKIRAPFRLTTMNQRGKGLLFWVWSRRGSQWTVDQELRFDCDSKRGRGGL